MRGTDGTSASCAREWAREREKERQKKHVLEVRERSTLRPTLRFFSFHYVASSLASPFPPSFIFISGDVYEIFHTMTCAFFSL